MAQEHGSINCRHCGTQTLAIRDTPNHVVHVLLTFLTLGLWLPVLVLSIFARGPWRCTRCGRKEEADWYAYGRWVRQHRTAAAVVGAVGVAIFGGFLLYVWRFLSALADGPAL